MFENKQSIWIYDSHPTLALNISEYAYYPNLMFQYLYFEYFTEIICVNG